MGPTTTVWHRLSQRKDPSMRFPKLLAAALVAAAIVPSGAQAHDADCASQIRLLTGRAILFDNGAINCSYIQEPGLDTDFLAPGGGSIVVRFNGSQPTDGDKVAGTGSFLQNGASKTFLKFKPATGADGAPLAGFWDADGGSYGATQSLTGGDFTAVVFEPITNAAPVEHTRAYHTIG